MITSMWYRSAKWAWILWPLSACFWLVIQVRRWYLQRFKQRRYSVPIIVVGNLTVGGVGKTPLVIALADALQAKGIRVGIVSRGYRARGHFPREVHLDDAASEVGDEPLLIRQRTHCPVVIAPKRTEAVEYLLQHHHPQVIISDDGLQHYAMGRDIEIAVIDGVRGLGNQLLLPAGPLRETKSRLNAVDFVVVNSGEWPNAYPMTMIADSITALINRQTIAPEHLKQPIAAIAAIGNPERFYSTLSALNLSFHSYSFPDHHLFNPQDLVFHEKTIVMTEKDAVKCFPFATEHMYFLPVRADLQPSFWSALWEHQSLKEVFSR